MRKIQQEKKGRKLQSPKHRPKKIKKLAKIFAVPWGSAQPEKNMGRQVKQYTGGGKLR